jgi:phosphoglycolate phosphatase
LKILLKEGFLLSIATNKFYQSAHDILTAAGLRSYFSLVLGADQVTRPKPDPEAGNLSLQKMNVSPENSIMVGDTTLDIYMAKSAGMRSIAVTYGIHSLQELKSSEPTWIADNFMEVISVIKDNVIVKEELKKC